MADELIRITTGGFVAADDQNVLATLLVPRHTRGTLLYVKAGLAVGQANVVLDGHVRVLALVPTVMVEGSFTPFINSIVNIMQLLKPVDITQIGITDVGTPTNRSFDFTLEMERDFNDYANSRRRVVGLALKSAGPSANNPIGWTLINTGFDETLDFSWFTIAEVLIEWPKNRSMRMPREHVANEENQ